MIFPEIPLPAGTRIRLIGEQSNLNCGGVGDVGEIHIDDGSNCPKILLDGEKYSHYECYEYFELENVVAAPEVYPDNNPKAAMGAKKVSLQLVPPVLMIEVAKVMQHGADKYGAFNFRESNIAATVYVGAILRHCLAIADGQDIDPESGESHWAHIAASCGIALDAQACGTFVDDRPGNGHAAEYLDANKDSEYVTNN